ncbi:hypothetical protein SDC9_208742 [bioreactor metagenome]|uniref:Uncharacterized protein n=1 Tax=bioreactor metagenome TaxID=1076179 RepID=A0A645JBE4_9ZZZZ
MLVGKPVPDLASIATTGHDPGSPQHAQRLRDGGFTGAGGGGEIADVQFAGLQQRVEQSGAGGVAHQLEERCHPGDLVRLGHLHVSIIATSEQMCMCRGLHFRYLLISECVRIGR